MLPGYINRAKIAATLAASKAISRGQHRHRRSLGTFSLFSLFLFFLPLVSVSETRTLYSFVLSLCPISIVIFLRALLLA
ncbi:hypothetical protein BDV93DRAFT_163296 [Ceratobasidium sp. AG-I]|nr:hypothetical protein BDV93DRAFT_163296 [Ceratobasidium sp. AG-I]